MDARLDILVKEDGVYVSINNSDDAPRVSRVDVLNMIEAYGVEDVDFVKVSEMLKSEDKQFEFKISDNKKIIQIPESASVEVSADRMTAFLVFTAPVNKGKLLAREEILEIIKNAGIKRIDSNAIGRIISSRRYETQIPIGKGKDFIPGSDGYLQYHFDRSHLRPKPKILEDGTVNFHQLGLLRLCNRGDVLVTAVPPSDGEPGEDVYGTPIPFPIPKAPQPIPKGKNTFLSEDQNHLIAEVSGQLILQDGKINISPCLEIQGDVDNSTGDIDFNGEVHVRGNVVSGFAVKAEGNIEIFGVCEGATLIAGGNIVLNKGVQGSDKAVLKAGKDITAKFIENSSVTAGGNITADSILKCNVKCDCIVTLTGKNGLLSGGSVIAGEKLIAKVIGSPVGTATDIEVGGNPQELLEHKELVGEYKKMADEYDRCETAVNTLNALRQKGNLNEDKRAILLKLINTKMQLRGKMNRAQGRIDELEQLLTVNSGTISASKAIRPGVRVSIGNAQLNIREELSNCRLKNDGSKISIGPNL